MILIRVNIRPINVYMKHTYDDMNLHVNIIMLHVEIIYLACRRGGGGVLRQKKSHISKVQKTCLAQTTQITPLTPPIQGNGCLKSLIPTICFS